MTKIVFSPEQATFLADRSARLAAAAREFSLFGDSDPELAAACGVEVGCLEARTILASGAPERVLSMASLAAKSGRPSPITGEDLDAISRLEAVISIGSARIGNRLAALSVAESQSVFERVGSIIGLATGAVGLLKSII